ncbi:hypothetical protein DFH08DRAFT_827666 [Mycena albidolilacea]|uniref:Uncharacterized protein n=1 Tax=Mycena albidolilacea TaxID=1033008 RepID=A0AAD7E7Y7_9AGAR|nr:hypothetical protein DFH08DRAFT_827666 [Mycena albidolilacea]
MASSATALSGSTFSLIIRLLRCTIIGSIALLRGRFSRFHLCAFTSQEAREFEPGSVWLLVRQTVVLRRQPETWCIGNEASSEKALDILSCTHILLCHAVEGIIVFVHISEDHTHERRELCAFLLWPSATCWDSYLWCAEHLKRLEVQKIIIMTQKPEFDSKL